MPPKELRTWFLYLLVPYLYLRSFYRRTKRYHGRFAMTVFAIYGLGQGLLSSFFWAAFKYTYSDAAPNGFGVTPNQCSTQKALVLGPWNFKVPFLAP